MHLIWSSLYPWAQFLGEWVSGPDRMARADLLDSRSSAAHDYSNRDTSGRIGRHPACQ